MKISLRLIIFRTILLVLCLSFVIVSTSCVQSGASAYEIAVKHGFDGSEEEWLQSLKGEQGEQGERGEKGDIGLAGTGIRSVVINEEGQLILTLSDGSTVNCGQVIGPQGEKGDTGEAAPIVQTTGSRTDAVMSQDAVSRLLMPQKMTAFVQDGQDTTSNYYKQVARLSTGKTYTIGVTPSVSGTYTVQAGNKMSLASMEDMIGVGTCEAGVEKLFTDYTPTGGYIYLRLDADIAWSVKVYEQIDVLEAVRAASDEASSTIRSMSVSAADFASVYGSAIGNLPAQSAVYVGANYAASDYPAGLKDKYLVLTMTDTLTTQTAISSNGIVYTRTKPYADWTEWRHFDALCPSGTEVGPASSYTSWNDFPVGSIIYVTRSATISDGPDGWENIGHVTLDSGPVTATVMTYAFSSAAAPVMKCQLAVIHRTGNYPRIAYRDAIFSGGVYTWTKWSQFSEDGALHATNTIVDINSYQTLTFSDFNDAPANTIYQVDYNCGDAVLHNPSPGHSGVLMTYAWSVTSRHALVQTHFALEDTGAVMYFRYGYQQSASEYVWTPWQKCLTADTGA